eukprot:1159626-Pelagomonas_calceolata.AAC.5
MSSQADRWKQAGDLLAISVLWSCTLEARMPGTDDAGTLVASVREQNQKETRAVGIESIVHRSWASRTPCIGSLLSMLKVPFHLAGSSRLGSALGAAPGRAGTVWTRLHLHGKRLVRGCVCINGLLLFWESALGCCPWDCADETASLLVAFCGGALGAMFGEAGGCADKTAFSWQTTGVCACFPVTSG